MKRAVFLLLSLTILLTSSLSPSANETRNDPYLDFQIGKIVETDENDNFYVISIIDEKVKKEMGCEGFGTDGSKRYAAYTKDQDRLWELILNASPQTKKGQPTFSYYYTYQIFNSQWAFKEAVITPTKNGLSAEITATFVKKLLGVSVDSRTISFEIHCNPHGDANGDGQYSLKDVLLIRKFLIGQSVSINKEKSNVDFNDKIDLQDVLYLRKCLAGMNDYLADFS